MRISARFDALLALGCFGLGAWLGWPDNAGPAEKAPRPGLRERAAQRGNGRGLEELRAFVARYRAAREEKVDYSRDAQLLRMTDKARDLRAMAARFASDPDPETSILDALRKGEEGREVEARLLNYYQRDADRAWAWLQRYPRAAELFFNEEGPFVALTRDQALTALDQAPGCFSEQVSYGLGDRLALECELPELLQWLDPSHKRFDQVFECFMGAWEPRDPDAMADWIIFRGPETVGIRIAGELNGFYATLSGPYDGPLRRALLERLLDAPEDHYCRRLFEEGELESKLERDEDPQELVEEVDDQRAWTWLSNAPGPNRRYLVATGAVSMGQLEREMAEEYPSLAQADLRERLWAQVMKIDPALAGAVDISPSAAALQKAELGSWENVPVLQRLEHSAEMFRWGRADERLHAWHAWSALAPEVAREALSGLPVDHPARKEAEGE